MSTWYEWQGDDLVLSIRVQPKSSADQFAGVVGDELKLKITAPPVDGKANKHLIAWIAKSFRVAKASVVIEQGQTSRHKRVRIVSPQTIPLELP